MKRRTDRTASELTTLMMHSPFVIADRMMEFWLTAASPSAKAKQESIAMVTEKLEAAGESMVAMNMAMARVAMGGMTAAWTGRRHEIDADVDDVLSAGLKPYTRRVKANQKRLSK